MAADGVSRTFRGWLTLWSGAAGPGLGFPLVGQARPALEVSDDGVNFRRVAEWRWPTGLRTGEIPVCVNFSPVRARYFRLCFPQARRISWVQLSCAPRIPDWPAKANSTGSPPAAAPAEQIGPEATMDPERVLDLTSRMDSQGRLSWEAPPGQRTILRISHTPTGTQNHPAPDGGLGLECDKYNRAAMDHHFRHFFGPLGPALKPLAARGLVGALIDSYEAGFQNWTPGFPEEFRRRCGYDLRRYLPAMTGRVVGSLEISERFLWDVRRTQADMMAENSYGRFAGLCRERGSKSYAEPCDDGPCDEMQVGSRVDVLMGGFWIARGNHRSVQLAASVAHVRGKAVVGAGAFTGAPQFSKWQEHPYSMKALGDWMFAQGINFCIFHRFAHQPHPTAAPGMTMGPWGFHSERTNTWWEHATAWLDHVARCQYLLQQDVFVADLLYFVGETAPQIVPTRTQLRPAPSPGYDCAALDRETLLTDVPIRQGRILLPGGATYRVLVSCDHASMTVEVARELLELVREGMWLVGPRPCACASLKGYPANDVEFRRIIEELWGDLDGVARMERAVGQGRVWWGEPLESLLGRLGLPPDFRCSARSADAEIHFIHRRLADADVYFVANRRRRTEDLVCSFRAAGKEPEP
ncbi:MAG: glycosyl hydrolase [Bryobacterales bacterium]|nr:glycosyl hydrolase [Bryobacteraceae bacterium]MDW8130399.1 glycosyl hydrolase [Bryobacterales bacterium]